jgi:hypothetical protein
LLSSSSDLGQVGGFLRIFGVGRTGTFIAIDALHEHGQKTGYIDIMEYVQMMRKDRMNMIQTKVSFLKVRRLMDLSVPVNVNIAPICVMADSGTPNF